MGGALDFIATDVFGVELFRDDVVYRFDHLGLSLGATYRTPGRIHGLLALGVMPSVLIQDRFDVPALLLNTGSVIAPGTNAQGFVLFGYGSIGGAVDLNGPLTVGLLARYDRGLTSLSRNSFFENEDLIETSWSLLLSVAYSLGQQD